jgi:hypothetical protein
MQTSLPYPEPSAPDMLLPDDDPNTIRLRGLTAEQLEGAMTFLAFWSPAAYAAVLDYCEATNWGAGPDALAGPDPEDDDHGTTDPEPVCGRCGADIGIFVKFGLQWLHYKGTGLDDIELYDPGHPPQVTWRTPASVATSVAPDGLATPASNF